MPDEQIPPPEPPRPARGTGADGPPPEAAAGSPPPPGATTPVPGPGPSGAPGAQPPPSQPEPLGAAGWPPQPAAGWAGPGPSSWESPGYPLSQPPSRRWSRRAAWLAGSAVVVVTALIAGSIGFVIGDQRSRIEAAAAGISAASAGCGAAKAPDPSATSPAGAALRARLLPVPSGASLITTEKQGVLSLNDYVHVLYSADPFEEQRLTARCFQVAVHRAWLTPGGTVISAWLVQFGSAAGARSYTLSSENADSVVTGNTVKFTVAGVGDGKVIAAPGLDRFGNTVSHLLGDKGDVAILIQVFVPAGLDNALAARILRQQGARL